MKLHKIKSIFRELVVKFFKYVRSTTGRSPPEWIFQHLHFVGPFTVIMPNNKTLTLYSQRSIVENKLAWIGWDGHEPLERRRWVQLSALGGDILDVGANTGTFAITSKCISPSSRVVAFEPIERIADMARLNIKTSGLNIHVEQLAVGRTEGELPIYDPGGSNVYSASLDPNFLSGKKNNYPVKVTSLDVYCSQHNLNPSAIKIDVEGYEGEALCGSQEILSRGKAFIICEWRCSTESHIEAIRILEENRYKALDIKTLDPIDLSQITEVRNILLAHVNQLFKLDVQQNITSSNRSQKNPTLPIQ
jgi:FkbM family methyltransferase